MRVPEVKGRHPYHGLLAAGIPSGRDRPSVVASGSRARTLVVASHSNMPVRLALLVSHEVESKQEVAEFFLDQYGARWTVEESHQHTKDHCGWGLRDREVATADKQAAAAATNGSAVRDHHGDRPRVIAWLRGGANLRVAGD